MAASSKKLESKALNLGIGSLVAGAISSNQTNFRIDTVTVEGGDLSGKIDENCGAFIVESKEASEAGFMNEFEPSSEISQAELSEYQLLAASRDWVTLIAICEQRLPAELDSRVDLKPSEIEARLWWVHSQEKLRQLPLQILAAPLDSVSLAIESVSFEDPSERIRLNGLTADLLVRISRQLQHPTERELALSFLERAVKLEPKHMVHLQHARQEEITRLKSDPAIAWDIALSAKVGKLEQLVGEKVEEGGASPKPSLGPGLPPRQVSRSYKILCAALIVLIVGGYMFLFHGTWESSSIGALAVDGSRVVGSEPSIVLPELARVQSLSSLDAIYYDINQSIDKDGNIKKAAIGSDGREGAVNTTSDSVANESAGNSLDEKEVVNTSSPVEIEEFQKIRERGPSINGEKASRARRADELFGGPNPRGELQGSITKSLPVQRFESEKIFAIISRTKVMSRPAFQGGVVAELEVGDKVKVDSIVGPWLKLRSKQGGVGYILSQDAEVTTAR